MHNIKLSTMITLQVVATVTIYVTSTNIWNNDVHIIIASDEMLAHISRNHLVWLDSFHYKNACTTPTLSTPLMRQIFPCKTGHTGVLVKFV